MLKIKKKCVLTFLYFSSCLRTFRQYPNRYLPLESINNYGPKKNLSVSKFQNGDDIPEAKTKQEWINAFENKRPAWCSYRNSSKNDSVFGKIYNWYTISDSRGICPPGFLYQHHKIGIYCNTT